MLRRNALFTAAEPGLLAALFKFFDRRRQGLLSLGAASSTMRHWGQPTRTIQRNVGWVTFLRARFGLESETLWRTLHCSIREFALTLVNLGELQRLHRRSSLGFPNTRRNKQKC